jgi:hypothetical protein
MRVFLMKEGLAISVGPFIFIPNHLTKAFAALGVASVAIAYSAKEFGEHRFQLYLDRVEIQEQDPQLNEGEQ